MKTKINCFLNPIDGSNLWTFIVERHRLNHDVYGGVTGSVNEAGVFTLRGRQEGGRRGRRTTTSTTSTTTSSSTLISLSDEVAQPAALLAPEEDLWSTSSSGTTNVPVSLDTAATPSKPPLELVVKPHSKVELPCELEGNYSRLLLPGAR